MSRIGKKPIPVPANVTVKIEDGTLSAKGPKGALARPLPPGTKVLQEKGQLQIQADESLEDRQAGAMQGLARSLVNNVIEGVTKGFERALEINGVGYRAEVQGQELRLQLGYTHPINYPLPPGISAKVDKQKIILTGIDKEMLGHVAAKVRSFRPPEPYKGKGIKYAEEVIRRKEGKTGAS